MDILLEALGPGVHCYSPFGNKSAQPASINLSELCKNRILRCVTLRRLSAAVGQLPLPRRLLRYIADLTTADFEKIECAPFSDVFSSNFLHRALTYRVACLLDGFEYMITYGYSPVEEPKLKPEHRGWVELRHPNVMCICATVRDPSTDNAFYVYDQPVMSLDQVCSAFRDRNQRVPDLFFWRVASDLCEALRAVLKQGLRYGPFWLDNVFVVDDRLVIENGLMRKGVRYCNGSRGDCASEESVLCDVVSILRHLVPDYDPSEPLLKFIGEIESESSIDAVIDLVNNEERNINSFSFLKLIQSLKD